MASSPSNIPVVEQAYAEAIRQRVLTAIGATGGERALDEYATLVAELLTWNSLQAGGQVSSELRSSAKRAYTLLLNSREEAELPGEVRSWWLRTASLAILADQPQEARKFLHRCTWSDPILPGENWAEFTRQTVYAAWLGLMRQESLDDVEGPRRCLAQLRTLQGTHEEPYLRTLESGEHHRAAVFRLIAFYLLGSAAEKVSQYLINGTADGAGDINAQLDMTFERCLRALERAGAMDGLDVALLLQPTAHQIVNSSLRAATRGANTLARKFAESLIHRSVNPIFQLLPPQRVALRERGLIASAHRSVVVNFPTSSGKTLLAQFSVLQALNDLGAERGWVAYVAPTRALVNQITSRLRRDFEPLEKRVERLSPALEFDTVELSALLPENEAIDGPPIDVVVCTPEKLDMLMRRDELREKLGRLALVVVDEAHSIGANDSRAIKLELLLSMINREHENARFLLLTPFVKNAERVARWLDQTSYKDYSIDAEWIPNDRIVGVASPPTKGPDTRGIRADHLLYNAVSTPKNTLFIPEPLRLEGVAPELEFTIAQLHSSVGNLATATAQVLSRRGPTVLLCRTVRDTWNCSASLAKVDWPWLDGEEERRAVARLVSHELGSTAPLVDLLSKGIAVHHAGLPEEISQAIEWLFENHKLHALCATTTLAQGVNFPIANLVLGSIYPASGYGKQMAYSDFWNIAGRVGRVDQEAIGVVALAAKDQTSLDSSQAFLKRAMHHLVSTLISMVEDLKKLGADQGLSSLTWKKEWSNFSQFIAHTLHQVGPEKFADQVELILRGTLGYQTLREDQPGMARELLLRTRQYANDISADMGSVKLVDSTGFSFESVRRALYELNALDNLDAFSDPQTLFSRRSNTLQEVMGVLLTIPEVRDDLVDVGGGHGGRLAYMLSDWVREVALEDLAKEYYPSESPDEDNVSHCVRKFKHLAMTSAWGLSSVLAMKFGSQLESMTPAARDLIVNIPSMVLYGVWSREAIALRSAGVPRNAAIALAKHVQGVSTPYALRRELTGRGESLWVEALGSRGRDYFRVWQMLDGGKSAESRASSPS